jgi:hypothetical protein
MRYATARGQVIVLEGQRDQLVGAARRMAVYRDSLRAANDTLGLSIDSLAALTATLVANAGAEAEAIVVRVVEVVPPDVAALVRRADSLRVVQVDSANARANRAEQAVRDLRAALFAERIVSDAELGNRDEQIINLELQVAAYARVAQTGWFGQLTGVAKWTGLGLTAGAASCWLGAPWCPS